MKPTHAALSLLAAAACVGCMYVPMGNLPSLNVKTVAVAAGGNAQARLTPVYGAGGLRVQSEMAAYSGADVNHLLVKLFVMSGDTEVPVPDGQGAQVQKDLSGAELNQPVAFTKLAYTTTYRIRAYAYKAAGTATADLISTPDASSSVDVPVAKDDRPIIANLPVQLIDQTFNGQGTASAIVFHDGQLNNAGTPTIH